MSGRKEIKVRQAKDLSKNQCMITSTKKSLHAIAHLQRKLMSQSPNMSLRAMILTWWNQISWKRKISQQEKLNRIKLINFINGFGTNRKNRRRKNKNKRGSKNKEKEKSKRKELLKKKIRKNLLVWKRIGWKTKKNHFNRHHQGIKLNNQYL